MNRSIPYQCTSAAQCDDHHVLLIFLQYSHEKWNYFGLRKLEIVELEEALVYEKVFDRCRNPRKTAEKQACCSLQSSKKFRRKFAKELEDLQAYAAHLRSTFTVRCSQSNVSNPGYASIFALRPHLSLGLFLSC